MGHLGHAFIFYGVGIGFAAAAFLAENVYSTASRFKIFKARQESLKEMDQSFRVKPPVKRKHQEMAEESELGKCSTLVKTHRRCKKNPKLEH